MFGLHYNGNMQEGVGNRLRPYLHTPYSDSI